MLKVVVLISGTGSLLLSLLDATAKDDERIEIVAVGADNDAPGLEYARQRGIETFVVRPKDFVTRQEWAEELLKNIRAHGVATKDTPGLIVSAGFMRILPEEFVTEVSPNLINTHPALLPLFPGAHAVRDALAAGATETGTTVHIIDAGVDTGPIIRQEKVPVLAVDSEETLHERIKTKERDLLVEVVKDIAAKKILLENL